MNPFLKNLKQRNFKPRLQKYVENGGILIGVSAGAMVLTPSLGLCDALESNKPSSKSNKGLGIVNFEFHPHFDEDEKTAQKISAYSKLNKITVYACNDDSGIIVANDKLECVGRVSRFVNGKI